MRVLTSMTVNETLNTTEENVEITRHVSTTISNSRVDDHTFQVNKWNIGNDVVVVFKVVNKLVELESFVSQFNVLREEIVPWTSSLSSAQSGMTDASSTRLPSR